ARSSGLAQDPSAQPGDRDLGVRWNGDAERALSDLRPRDAVPEGTVVILALFFLGHRAADHVEPIGVGFSCLRELIVRRELARFDVLLPDGREAKEELAAPLVDRELHIEHEVAPVLP